MTYVIRDDIPVPRRTAGAYGSKYPFAQLEVGQAFVVTGDVKPATVRSAIGAYVKKNGKSAKFSVRAVEADAEKNIEAGVGVWRTE